MSLAVDNPIINSPFEEPSRWWDYSEGQPVLREGRRGAGYYLRPRSRTATGALFEEEFVLLDVVNDIRVRVKAWREQRYPGTTRVTQELLAYWSRQDRERKLFFCQREAAETVIWLVEAPATERMGLDIPLDLPGEEDRAKGYAGLKRYGCKMATGAGKTVVMGMLVAWSVLNKVHYPQDRRFSDAILVVTPNLTVKERDEVLKPSHAQNIHEQLDLVPRSLLEALGKGRYFVTNWHRFLPEDEPEAGEQTKGYRSVVRRGKESDKAFAARVLKELGGKENILVFLEVLVGRDQGGFSRLGEGGGEAVGIGEVMVTFNAGSQPAKARVDVRQLNRKLGSLLELRIGRFLPVRPPNRVINLAPVDYGHQQGAPSLGSLGQKLFHLFPASAILEEGHQSAGVEDIVHHGAAEPHSKFKIPSPRNLR